MPLQAAPVVSKASETWMGFSKPQSGPHTVKVPWIYFNLSTYRDFCLNSISVQSSFWRTCKLLSYIHQPMNATQAGMKIDQVSVTSSTKLFIHRGKSYSREENYCKAFDIKSFWIINGLFKTPILPTSPECLKDTSPHIGNSPSKIKI